jgi:hypothetical protein
MPCGVVPVGPPIMKPPEASWTVEIGCQDHCLPEGPRARMAYSWLPANKHLSTSWLAALQFRPARASPITQVPT